MNAGINAQFRADRSELSGKLFSVRQTSLRRLAGQLRAKPRGVRPTGTWRRTLLAQEMVSVILNLPWRRMPRWFSRRGASKIRLRVATWCVTFRSHV